MAVGDATTSTRLSARFALNSNDERTFSIPNPKENLTPSEVGTFMTAMVENGDAFADPIKSALSAELITTTRTVMVDNT